MIGRTFTVVVIRLEKNQRRITGRDTGEVEPLWETVCGLHWKKNQRGKPTMGRRLGVL